jgi:hypothetical protein
VLQNNALVVNFMTDTQNETLNKQNKDSMVRKNQFKRSNKAQVLNPEKA